jgi:hypothetical protein
MGPETKICRDCKGSGVIGYNETYGYPMTCQECRGTGRVVDKMPLDGSKIEEKLNKQLQAFSSGATSSERLPPYDLITIHFEDRVAKRLQLGAAKHGRFNYRKGLKDKEFIIDRLNHALRHIKIAAALIENGETFSDDDLAGVAVNVMMAMEYQLENGLVPTEGYLPVVAHK